MAPEGDHGGRIEHPGTFAPNIARKLSVDAMSHGSAIGNQDQGGDDMPKFTLNVNVSGNNNANQQQLNQNQSGAQGAAATPLNQVGKSGADFGTDPNSQDAARLSEPQTRPAGGNDNNSFGIIDMPQIINQNANGMNGDQQLNLGMYPGGNNMGQDENPWQYCGEKGQR